MHNHQLIQTKDSMSQPERLIQSLLPENMKIDQRGMADLLTFMHQLAAQINFYNTENRLQGDWTSFLERDLHILTAILSKWDISPLIKKYDQLKYGIRNADTDEQQVALFSQLLQLFDGLLKVMQEIEAYFNTVPDQSGIAAQLSIVLRSYIPELEGMRKYGNINTASASEQDAGANEQHILKALAHIDPVFSDIKAKHAYLQSTAGDALLTNDLLTQEYSPHIGLLLTFLHLYSHLQQDLNGLTRKHLDLYYHNILHIPHLPAIADQVLIFFEPDPTMKAAFPIPSGTELLATAAGTEKTMTYRTLEDLLLSKARITDLKTIYVSDDSILARKGEDNKVREARIYQGSYQPPLPKDLMKQGAVIDTWPILGEDQIGLAEKDRTMLDASVGIVVGSPTLYLPEGERSICLEFVFTKDSYRIFYEFIKNFAKATRKGQKVEGKPIELVYMELLSNAFTIDYTAPNGWEPVGKYIFRKGAQANSMEILFELGHSMQPLQSYKKEIHKAMYTASMPLVRIMINNDASHNAYSFLKDLVIERVTIRSDVREAHSVKLQNNIGVLSAANPFQIFGPQPSVGSYLDIKNTNIFNRYTTDFSIRLEWLNLPSEPHGFKSYYEAYGANITNKSYRVRACAVAGGRYDMQGSAVQDFYLFEQEEKDTLEYLLDLSWIEDVDMKKFEFTGKPLMEKEDTQPDPVFKEGALRIELISPPEAFGHQLFPQVFLKAMQNKKSTLPNQPYIPLIKSITLSYTLSYSVLLQTSAAAHPVSGNSLVLFHQHPFGYNELFPKNDQYAYPFMPQFGARNNLYIGLSDAIASEELTLLFQLEEKKFHHSAHIQGIISWSYLQDNKWVNIDAKSVLSDSTNGFINSGILRIILPDNIQNGNTILDPALYWLRASANVRKSSMAKVVAIYAHGVLAQREIDPGETDPSAFRLAPGSIKDLKKRQPQILNIWQLFPSFNGLPAETGNNYYVRVSERLRHKQRPLTTRDIEQFILKEFPNIFLAKCFGIGAGSGMILPGVNVQVIVIPKEKENGLFSSDEPQVSLAELYRIKNWLMKVLSPFQHVEVGNPVYEKVKIACAVKFTQSSMGDQGLLPARLHQDIKRYLCPWLFEEGSDIIIGGKIYLSDILNFIKHLPYVEYVTGFSVVHFFKVQDINTGGYTATAIDSARRPIKFICGSIPGAVLIPSEQHLITVLNKPQYMDPKPMGIGQFAIGLELYLGKSKEIKPDIEEGTAAEAGNTAGEVKPSEETEKGTAYQPEEIFDLFINHHNK